ncbi:MAG: tRNA uridine-5-carboxymethylaminomethyl(34) synthesis GTPase MnmE, partial [Alphaproteobacteria bacterium]|nr:tRNA uridine-5-carboxymethylaminomethyl(34) synthesis GTPase MnmE [Alphaproteobacteria bacterium]
MNTSTVYALATARGRSAIAVFRLSGPATAQAVTTLTGRPLPPPRTMRHTVLCDGEGARIDRGLVVWFPGPASFTGEDMAELHVHGGRAVIEAVAAALDALPGVTPAEPGAFARRAFEHGKLDLTQVEAIADLVAAETEAQRRQALRQLEGGLGARCRSWRVTLVRALAHVEAYLDFPDEEIPATVVSALAVEAAAVAREIACTLADGRAGERLRDGFSAVILGAPNVGKSSLLNRLAGREAAIVAARAGTTRDVVEVRLELCGSPLVVADTAGIRAAADEIEAQGVQRALARADHADLRIVVLDCTGDAQEAALALAVEPCIVVANKTDRAPLRPEWWERLPPPLPISARTGAGLAA